MIDIDRDWLGRCLILKSGAPGKSHPSGMMNKLWQDLYDYNSQVQCTILPHEEIDRDTSITQTKIKKSFLISSERQLKDTIGSAMATV